MYLKSTYKHQLEFQPHLKIAIIYSLEELFAYAVEIKEMMQSKYLSEGGEISKFGNMDDARNAALKAGAQVLYLALPKTSEETDISTCHADHQERYDYEEIPLHAAK